MSRPNRDESGAGVSRRSFLRQGVLGAAAGGALVSSAHAGHPMERQRGHEGKVSLCTEFSGSCAYVARGQGMHRRVHVVLPNGRHPHFVNDHGILVNIPPHFAVVRVPTQNFKKLSAGMVLWLEEEAERHTAVIPLDFEEVRIKGLASNGIQAHLTMPKTPQQKPYAGIPEEDLYWIASMGGILGKSAPVRADCIGAPTKDTSELVAARLTLQRGELVSNQLLNREGPEKAPVLETPKLKQVMTSNVAWHDSLDADTVEIELAKIDGMGSRTLTLQQQSGVIELQVQNLPWEEVVQPEIPMAYAAAHFLSYYRLLQSPASGPLAAPQWSSEYYKGTVGKRCGYTFMAGPFTGCMAAARFD